MNNTAEAVDTMVEAVTEASDAKANEPAMRKKASGITKEAKIKVLADSNPKRSGSKAYDRFEGYLTDPAPTTVQEALDNGLLMGDIHYDCIHGSIEVEDAEIVEYQPAIRGPRSEAQAQSDEAAAINSEAEVIDIDEDEYEDEDF